MELSDLTYTYNPEPDPVARLFGDAEPGVAKGYVVIWNGEPGPAQIADAGVLIGENGEVHLTLTTGEFKPTTVVDD